MGEVKQQQSLSQIAPWRLCLAIDVFEIRFVQDASPDDLKRL
jgi:hypothetical protein